MCRIHAGRLIVAMEVTSMRPTPEDPGPWREVFGPGVRFGQTDNSFPLSAADCDRPRTDYRPVLPALIEEAAARGFRLDALLARCCGASSTASRWAASPRRSWPAPAVAVVRYSRKFFISHSAMPRSEM
jgi:hypothetical protein